MILPFVNGTRFYARKGWTGVTGNIYCGLHEFTDMGFVLHFLRQGDLFVDIGANMGSYTILASGVCAADSIALEPVPDTFERLTNNVGLNGIATKVKALNCGLAAAEGELYFSTDKDTMNGVADAASLSAVPVPVTTLDALLEKQADDYSVLLLKIDVEGYETAVLQGAALTLADERLKAIIIELNGSGAVYGFEDTAIHQLLTASGFHACTYDPYTRVLAKQLYYGPHNTLYIRDKAIADVRLKTAPAFTVLEQQL